MDAGALCLFGEAPLAGLPRELKLPLACVLRQRARLLRDGGHEPEARRAFGAARMLIGAPGLRAEASTEHGRCGPQPGPAPLP